MNLKIEVPDLQTNSATAEVKINDERTDARLIAILKNIKMEIYEVKKEEEGNEEAEEENQELVQTVMIELEEIEKLKLGEVIQKQVENLKSNTKYKLKFTGTLKQGEVEEEVNTIISKDNFTTLKMPAEVQIKNQFVTGDMIDFDVRIEDKDNAVLNNKVRIEVRDEARRLIKMQNIDTNQDYLRMTYEKLTENTNYTISFYADEYNEGSDDSTFKGNYLIKEIIIYTEPGISGKIRLNNLIRIGTGKNLVDVQSKVKWYSTYYNTSLRYGKEYNEEDNSLKLYAGYNGGTQRYVYDLRDYVGQTVTASFYAKIDEDTTGIRGYFERTKTGSSRTELTDLSKTEWKLYTFTLNVDTSGYLGFFVQSTDKDDAHLLIKDFQVELGKTKTSYKPYTYDLEAKISVDLVDLRNEIEEDDYYIRIYKNSELVITENYKEINEENKVENAIKKFILEDNSKYDVELVVKVRDRFYVISKTDFTSETGEILGIDNSEDFKLIQPDGNYIITNDIETTGYFGSNIEFNGTLDFQGNTLTKYSSKGTTGMLYNIGRKGVVKNVVLDVYIDNTIEFAWYRSLFIYNYGTISNIMVNLKQCNQLANNYIYLIGEFNYGTIENFVVNFQEHLYGSRELTGGVRYNYGNIKNGYLYGKSIEAIFSMGAGQSRNSAGLVMETQGGIIENVYSLVNVNTVTIENTTDKTANLVYSNNIGIIQNVYSVGIGNTTDLSSGPTIALKNVGKIYNALYFCDKIFTNAYNTKSTPIALQDKLFQNQILNSDNQFEVDDLIDQKYYPHVKLSYVMPNQEYIELPEIQDEDLIDILALEVIEDKGDKIKAELSVHNPAGEQITNIRVKDVTCKVLSQEYAEGKSTVIVELSNPVRYVSKYSVMAITSKGALNIPYTRNFEENERILNVDFYREVNNIEDWKEINKIPTENYKLMTDLDFNNLGSEILITNQYTGKIDGNNHTIKNIKIPENITYGLFKNLNGEVKNLNIENYTQESGTYMGLIYETSSNAKVDNVHMKNVYLNVNSDTVRVGALIGVARQAIVQNSSVADVTIEKNIVNTDTAIGGIVGWSEHSIIQYSYAQNVNIKSEKSYIDNGIGGIVGREAGSGGTIQYCYSTGKIYTDAQFVGGIYGYTSGVVNDTYSILNIYSQGDYIGGIGGYDANSSTTSTKENIYLGNLYTQKNTTQFHRILGNNVTELKNYAYKDQLLNGYISDDKEGVTLLTKEEVLNAKTYENIFEDYNKFDYSELEKGILPKLYNMEGTELLPYQQDNTLFNTELKIDYVTVEKADVNTAMIRVEINNPQELNVTSIDIEYMDIQIEKNITENGKTYIDLVGKPQRYYDSYTITKIKYEENGKEEEQDEEAKVDMMFFKEINSFEDWQQIDDSTAQNYMLMTDIDFEGKINPNVNVSIGRLETSGEMHTLKNLTIKEDITNGISKFGFIKEAKSSIKNIKFENITITKTVSNSYLGLISRNTAQMDNVVFENITLNVKSSSYIGIIAYNTSEELSNITLKNITITGGVSYVAGLCGYTTSGDFHDITADNIQISATGSYVAGILGYVIERSVYLLDTLSISNSTITSKGSYIGGVIGYGRGEEFESINNNISGDSYVGGVIGQQLYNANENQGRYYTAKNVNVTGSGNYIGGVAGYSGHLRYAYCFDSNIEGTATSTQYVGGISGSKNSSLYYSGVKNCTIVSKGSYVGGATGYEGSGGVVQQVFVQDTTVEGLRNVGGIAGLLRQGSVNYCYTNAKIKATQYTAGGIVGLVNNEDMTNANYVSKIQFNISAGVQVEAPSQVGGLIGAVEEDIYGNTYYVKNLVEAYLASDVSNTVSLGVGNRRDQNYLLADLYVYKYSTLNGSYVSEDNDTINKNNYLTLEDLKSQATYTGKLKWTGGYSYTTLAQNKYPIVGTTQNQTGIDLPKEPLAMQNKIMTTMLFARSSIDEVLPEINVYASGVNKINLEFDKTDKNSYFQVTIGENSSEKISLLSTQVFTFEYDFKTNIQVQISNGAKIKTISISPEEVRNNISLYNNKFYSLQQNKLYENVEEKQGSFVNIYKDKVLADNGNIYNLENLEKVVANVKTQENTIKETISGTEENELQIQNNLILENEEQAENKLIIENIESTNKQSLQLAELTPLEQFEYNGTKIEVFNKISIVTKADNQVAKSQRIYVVQGRLSTIDSSIEIIPNGIVIDYYNEKEYQTIIGKDGKLYDLKNSLKYPNNFDNSNIDSICYNMGAEEKILLVHYKSGRVVAFNYMSGQELFDNSVKEEIGLFDFIKQKLDVKENLISNVQNLENEYKEAKKLEETLKQTPISVAQQNIEKNIQNINQTENIYNQIGNEYKNQNENQSTNEYNNSIEGQYNSQIDSNKINNNTNETNIETDTNNLNIQEQNNFNENTTKEEASENSNQYVTSYDANSNKFVVYNVEDILDTQTEEIISENAKIQGDLNLAKFYNNTAKEKQTNETQGWIYVTASIVFATIALAILYKRKNLTGKNTKT